MTRTMYVCELMNELFKLDSNQEVSMNDMAQMFRDYGHGEGSTTDAELK